MKNLTTVYVLFGFVLLALIILSTQYSSLVYNSEKSCNDRIDSVKEEYGDYGWYKENYKKLVEKNRGTYIVTYDKEGNDYNNNTYTIRRTITCNNSLAPTLDERDTLHIPGCGIFQGVNAFNFVKK